VSIKNSFLNNKLFLLLVSFTVLVNYLLLNLPLFKEFSYEFASLNALLFFITVPVLVFHNKKKGEESAPKYFQIILLILTPLIVVLISLLFIKICSFLDGFFFFLIIALVSSVIAFFLAEIIYFISPKRPYLFLIISLIILISIPIIELYLYPQIYFYSPLIGFFPGSIYDEDIGIEAKLIIYRILNLLFIYIFFLVIRRNIIKNKIVFSLLILTGLVTSFLISPKLGFSTNKVRLKNVLPNRIETNEFVVFYDKLDSLEQKILTLYFTYYYSELQNKIKTTPSKKIEAFLFENDEDKREYFGSGNADVAKPWLYQIYLDRNSWKSTLKHELAHIFSAEFGSSLLKLSGSLNPFLIEGFATAIDPFIDIISIDYLAALHYKTTKRNIIPELKSSMNFFGFNSTLSYLYSGSFCKYLIETHGIEKFKQFYNSNDFEKSYQKEFLSVYDEYLKFLNSITVDTNSATFDYYFGRKALIQKDCPRFIEKKIKEAWNHFEKGDIKKSKSLFYEILNHSDNYSALSGLTECLIKQDSISKAVSLIETSISKFHKTPYEYLLKFRLSDLYSLSESYDKAIELYKNLENNKPNFNLQLLSNFRMKLFYENFLKDYLVSDDSAKLNILLKLNEEKYVYSSIPILITLSKNLNTDYEQFLQFFNKPFVHFDEYSFYAFLKLSQFMVDHFDFTRARKMAALSKRINSKDYINDYLDNNYKMIEWFYFNSSNF